MNLHAIAGSVITAINPVIPAELQVSTGNTTGPDGVRTPTFDDPVMVQAQVQAMTFRDIQQIDGLNLQGNRNAIYLFGKVDGLVREQNKGGDLITIADGPNAGVYLVAMVLEQWPDWVKCAVTLQNGA